MVVTLGIRAMRDRIIARRSKWTRESDEQDGCPGSRSVRPGGATWAPGKAASLLSQVTKETAEMHQEVDRV